MSDRLPLGHCGPDGDEEERAEPGPRAPAEADAIGVAFDRPTDPSADAWSLWL